MTKQEFLDKVDQRYAELQEPDEPYQHTYRPPPHRNIRSNQVKALIDVLWDVLAKDMVRLHE